jgi:hypothetical protein
MECRIRSIYINLILIEHEDPILQEFSFNFTCIDPILLNNNHGISDHNEIRFYMACRIGSIYINLILIELEDTNLQALGFDSICIDPILHGINHVISDPNEIQSYMACRIRYTCKSNFSSEMNIRLYMHKGSILPV